MISKNALEEYKEIHRQETGEIFSDDILLDEAVNLLTLFDRVYRPIKKEWLKEYEKRDRAIAGTKGKISSKNVSKPATETRLSPENN